MKTTIQYNQCFTKTLEGKWTWMVPVWFSKVGMFADCVISSPEGKTFETQALATKHMAEVLGKLEIV